MFGSHVCPPEWEATMADEDCIEKAFGHDACSAAEQFAEDNFAAYDYPEEMEIWVRKDQSDRWLKFDVEVHPVPEFTVTEKEDK